MSLSKPPTRNFKKCLFQNTQIPASELGQMMSTNKMSLNQVKRSAKLMRSWKGRNSFEPGVLSKLREADKSLQPFFSLNACEMDSSIKEDRANGKKITRPVVYSNDILGLIDNILHHRGFDSDSVYFIKIGIDGGGSFLKVCINI